MIADKSRGWSWTRVLLGMPAQQLHLCGDPAAAGLLRELAGHCADTLMVQRYKRLSPLVVEPRALQGLSGVQQGDAVVAFGRKALHKLMRNILKTSSSSSRGWQQQQHSVGMVYGALPPEARRMQAALFNAGVLADKQQMQRMCGGSCRAQGVPKGPASSSRCWFWCWCLACMLRELLMADVLKMCLLLPCCVSSVNCLRSWCEPPLQRAGCIRCNRHGPQPQHSQVNMQCPCCWCAGVMWGIMVLVHVACKNGRNSFKEWASTTTHAGGLAAAAVARVLLSCRGSFH
jgi:hypothetical protein